MANIMAGFRTTGVYPFSRSVVLNVHVGDGGHKSLAQRTGWLAVNPFLQPIQ